MVNKRVKFIFCIFFISFQFISRTSFAGERGLEERDKYLSLIRLVSSPNEFDGNVVQAYGVLRVYLEGEKIISAIVCTDVESAKRRIRPNCLLLDSDSIKNAAYLKKYSGKYVVVNGFFSRADSVVEMYVGAIKKVQAIELIEQ